MNKKPLFSIIVPIYNVEKFLKECIDSILKQTFTNFEIILVDDGSMDSCSEICDFYQAKDERIVVIHKKNGGLVSARNAGVRIAKGTYVGYVDGDDWVDRYWLEKVAKVIDDNNPSVISYNAFKSIDGKNIPLNTTEYFGYYNREEIEGTIVPNMLYNCNKKFYSFGVLPAVWSKIVYREILLSNLCEDERITFGEDTACSYSVLLNASSYVGLVDNLYYYRQNNGAMTKAYDIKRFERIHVLFEYLQNHLLVKDKSLIEQFRNYKVFCVFFAIINEAKSADGIFKVANITKEKMKKWKYQEYINDFKSNNFGWIWHLFLLAIKSKNYLLLVVLCKIIIKVKYSYKK